MTLFVDKKIAITGYSGFIGSNLVESLNQENLLLLGRSSPEVSETNFMHEYLDLEQTFDVVEALRGVDVIVHLAANAQSGGKVDRGSTDVYLNLNVTATENLARQAAKAGVKRFIFISSIKVNGELTDKDCCFNASSEPHPVDYYGKSKLAAENRVKQVCAETEMEWVIIRPPLVYGPNVKGNFESLIKLALLPIPLPFSRVNNARSMIYIGNLVDLIVCCIDSKKASNKLFLVSDNSDISLSSLISIIRKNLLKQPMLFPFPVFMFKLIAVLTRRQALVNRLIGNLQIDVSETLKTLEWQIPYSMEEGLINTVNNYQV